MKTVKYIVDGTVVKPITFDDTTVIDRVPTAVYSLRYSQFQGFYLEHHSDKFTVPSEMYGSVSSKADKVVAAYDDRKGSTGVLMSGDKGAGKTMTSALICNKMLERGTPVVLIETCFFGAEFNKLVNQLGECVLFFDEFGKTFKEKEDEASQEHLLSLFDGVGSNKRLILLTENDTYRINEFMLNRPGRVFYHFRFGKVDVDTIKSYCTAKSVGTEVSDKIVTIRNSSYKFSFDMLKAVVEEYNRFGGDLDELTRDLNIPVRDTDDRNKYELTSVRDAETGESYEFKKLTITFDDEFNSTHAYIKIPDSLVENPLGVLPTADNSFIPITLGISDVVVATDKLASFYNKRKNVVVNFKPVHSENNGSEYYTRYAF